MKEFRIVVAPLVAIMKDQVVTLGVVKGAVAYGVSIFYCLFCFRYVCRLCINFWDKCASTLGDIPPFFMLLTFISCFVIDFLSI